MKFIVFFLLSFSPVTFASDYNALTGQLHPDRSYLAGPRDKRDPVPFTEPDPRQEPGSDERNPYPSPDYAPDYQRDPEPYLVQSTLQDSRNWDPRFTGVICQSILAQHSRWH